MDSDYHELLLTLEALFYTAVLVLGPFLFSWYSHSLYHHIPGTGSYRKKFIRPWPVKVILALWLIAGLGLIWVRVEMRRNGWSAD